MSQIPKNLKYVSSHEWIRQDSDGNVTIGITDHAQDMLGDIVYVELPSVGDVFQSDDRAGGIDSVKTASDIYSPIAGEIIEVNDKLDASPDLVNTSPYEEGWFFRMKPSDVGEIEALLSADEYAKEID